jgi:hypothetical protein
MKSALDMFNEGGGDAPTSGSSKPIGTFLAGQSSGNGAITTAFGGQSGGSGNVGAINELSNGALGKKAGELATKAGVTEGGKSVLAKMFGFYGGETCDQIRRICPVKIVGEKQILSKDEKSFYNNVVIPRKKV